MGKHNRYTLKYRRRREGKTNYKTRLNLLKSRKPRLVVRKSNKNVSVQLVSYSHDGDLVKANASTQQLAKFGWKQNTGNLPAAYLAGYLAGVNAKKAKVTEAIVDLGLQSNFHGGRLFAAVKGAMDAGLSLPVSEDAFPSEERLSGAHISEKISKEVEDVKKKIGA